MLLWLLLTCRVDCSLSRPPRMKHMCPQYATLIRKMINGDLDGMTMMIGSQAGVTRVRSLANQTKDMAGMIIDTRCGVTVAAVPGGICGGS